MNQLSTAVSSPLAQGPASTEGLHPERMRGNVMGIKQGWIWLASLLLAVTLMAGWQMPAQAASLQAGQMEEGMTELTGPLQIRPADDPVGDWTVAGITIAVSTTTRIDERVNLAVVGVWVNVEGRSDGAGGLIAHRIKVTPPRESVKIEGHLTSLSDTEVGVDGISAIRNPATVIIGAPAVGDAVEVKAALQANNSLLAVLVEARQDGADQNPDKPNGPPTLPGAHAETELLGIIQSLPVSGTVGAWMVSGVPVDVASQTEIRSVAGPILVGAWVKVEGAGGGNGHLAAREIKSVATGTAHQLQGVLDSLDGDSVVVAGIAVDRNEATVVDGAPTPGQRVEVLAQLQGNETLLATRIDGKRQEPQSGADPNVVRFVGLVESLPLSGTLGQWIISSQPVTVTGATEIDEHKAALAQGVRVQVKAARQPGGLVAIEIEVLPAANQEDHENQPGGAFTRFTGLIENMPDQGLIGLWMVAGHTVTVTQRTEIQARQAMTVGALVKVKGYVQPDAGVRATEIELEEASNDLPDHREVHFQGEIQDRPANDPLGTWRIGDRQVEVVAGTQIREEKGAATAGARVKVEGVLQPDNTILAASIEVLGSGQDDQKQDQYARFRGVVETMPSTPGRLGVWQIRDRSGVLTPVAVTPETRLQERPGQPIIAGSPVEVEGRVGPDGTVVAAKIKGEDPEGNDDPGEDGQHIEFHGMVTVAPASADGVGLWQIRSGRDVTRTVETTTITVFKNGIPLVGDGVEVKGALLPGGTVLAQEMERKQAEEPGDGEEHENGQQVEFRGLVVSGPADPNGVGEWQIRDGRDLTRTVVASSTTTFEGGVAVAGNQVEVRGLAGPDGMVHARSIRLLSDSPGDNPGDMPGQQVEFRGLVVSGPADASGVGEWQIRDGRDVTRTVVASSTTTFEGGVAVAGNQVEVRGLAGPDGMVHARSIRLLSDSPGGDGGVDFTGAIVTFPAGLMGEWLVGDTKVMATQKTELRPNGGAFDIGVTVRVQGITRLDGVVMADRIEIED